MAVQQMSVFVGNEKGALAKALAQLAGGGIDLRALSIADTADFGILRFIANDNAKAAAVLTEGGYIFSETPVVTAYVPDKPGGLAREMAILADAEINVEYLYAFVTARSSKACVVLRVADPEAAEQALCAHGVELVSEQDVRA